MLSYDVVSENISQNIGKNENISEFLFIIKNIKIFNQYIYFIHYCYKWLIVASFLELFAMRKVGKKKGWDYGSNIHSICAKVVPEFIIK